MYRLSNYNIYLKINHENYLLIHGIYGSFDLVEKKIYDALIFCRDENDGVIKESEFTTQIFDSLIKRGYITKLSFEDELEKFKAISNVISSKRINDLSLTIIPTYNCNFRCEYCFERKIQEKGAKVLGLVMTPEIVNSIFAIIDKMTQNGRRVKDICLFGGEPLLKSNYKIVEYICEKATERGIDLSCITNGYDFDKYIDLIKKHKFTSAQITIDGVGKTHDSRRFLAGGNGTFEKITNNIDLALKKDIKIMIRTNVNKKNISEIRNLINYYYEKGWTNNSNFYYYFKSTHRCYEVLENQYSDLEIVGELAKIYHELGITNRNNYINSQFFLLSKSIREMISKNTYATMSNAFCKAGLNMFVLDPFKNIYACWDSAGEEKKIIGKIDVENNEFVFNDNHKRWTNRNVGNIEKCSKCPYAFFCGGGCAAHANFVNGDIISAYCDGFQQVFNRVAVDVCKEFIGE